MRAAAARVYAGATASFVAFAVWVSLIPFDHRPASFDDAVYMLWFGGRLGTVRFSLADAIANLLLFVPIGLFASAAIKPTRAGRAAMVIAGGLLLSAALEFCQAFVIWRTPSHVDVVAEGLGTVLGLMLWRLFRPAADSAVAAHLIAWRRATIGRRVLVIYAVAFMLAWLFPFDFTLQPSDLADKYFHKRLLPPFAPSPDAASALDLALVCAAAIPLGCVGALITGKSATRRAPTPAVLVTMAGLIVLTIAQAAVFSRTTDFTVVVAALPGITLGAMLAPGWRSRPRLATASEQI